ncbi:MAG: hypothetical protein R2712_31110 [Vicinamibacterales bacterium]
MTMCRRGWWGSFKTLLYMAQLASISMDPFFSTVDALDMPDQVAIDLDPQPGATFAQILDVARWVRDAGGRVNVRATRRPPAPRACTSSSRSRPGIRPTPRGCSSARSWRPSSPRSTRRWRPSSGW